MSLWYELKRRNVVRVAIAYVVVSWVVLQAADVLGDILELPGGFAKGILIILLIGFPIALFLSWAYEATPEGFKKTQEVDKSKSITHNTGQKLNKMIIAFLGVAVVFLLIDKFFISGGLEQAEAGQASIAVLPFVNMSDDESNEYFAEGLSEEILNVLAKVPDLKVAGRTSSFQFKGQNLDLRKIGTTLGVATILEGSVRKQDNRVRITAQLIRASDGFHLWSETYDRNLEDIFEVQDEISKAIFDQLSVTLNLGGLNRASAPPTNNMAAYDRYLAAKTLLAKRGKTNLINAARNLEEATQLDPTFADAWAVLAQVYSLFPYYLAGPSGEFQPKAEAAARRALALNPDLGTAHAGLADALRDQGRLIEAEAEYKRALALNPNEVEANSQYAQFLMRVGKYQEGLSYALKSSELDPLSAVNSAVVSGLNYGLGNVDKAMVYIEQSKAIDTIGYPHLIYAGLEMNQGNFKAAKEGFLYFAEIVETNRVARKIGPLAEVLEDREQTLDFLRRELAEAKRTGGPAAFPFAFWGAASAYGDKGLAVEMIHYYLDHEPDSFDPQMFSVPQLWDYPPFKKLIAEKSGFLDYWKANGFPPGCQAVGDKDYACS